MCRLLGRFDFKKTSMGCFPCARSSGELGGATKPETGSVVPSESCRPEAEQTVWEAAPARPPAPGLVWVPPKGSGRRKGHAPGLRVESVVGFGIKAKFRNNENVYQNVTFFFFFSELENSV